MTDKFAGMSLNILIDGESAKELFAMGPKDIIYFLKKELCVNPSDVKVCSFGNNSFKKIVAGEDSIRHKDNINLKEGEEK